MAAPAALSQDEIAAVKKARARYIFHDGADYQPLLGEVEGAPPILIACGHTGLALANPVETVGARDASAGATRLARELAERGHVVVSGLARGIDTAAHKGALEAEHGATIAVIASGIDIAYPPGNAALQEQIAENGLLLTELPPGTEPTSRHFLAHNRIIAALGLGTLVVEAAPGSGSRITARLATELGREVMAVPGSPPDPRSRGCNALIRDGAILVQDAGKVMELIAGFGGGERLAPVRRALAPEKPIAAAGPNPPETAAFPSPAETDIPAVLANLLSHAPVAVDEIIRQSGTSASGVQTALIELELAERLTRHAGGKLSLAS